MQLESGETRTEQKQLLFTLEAALSTAHSIASQLRVVFKCVFISWASGCGLGRACSVVHCPFQMGSRQLSTKYYATSLLLTPLPVSTAEATEISLSLSSPGRKRVVEDLPSHLGWDFFYIKMSINSLLTATPTPHKPVCIPLLLPKNSLWNYIFLEQI